MTDLVQRYKALSAKAVSLRNEVEALRQRGEAASQELKASIAELEQVKTQLAEQVAAEQESK